MKTRLRIPGRSFRSLIRVLAAVPGALLLCVVAAHGAPEAANRAAGAEVYVSSSPNPAWVAAQAVDGLTDTNHGWVGSSDQDAPAWIAIEFKKPVRVGIIRFTQAGLTEAGANRFARPRELKIFFDNAAPVTVVLEDREREPQRLEIEPVTTTTIQIQIISSYEDAKFPFLAGFQEIEVYEAGLEVAPAEEKPAADKSDQGGKDEVMSEVAGTLMHAEAMLSGEETSAPPPDTNGLDTEERELLELLGAFMDKLETYLENH